MICSSSNSVVTVSVRVARRLGADFLAVTQRATPLLSAPRSDLTNGTAARATGEWIRASGSDALRLRVAVLSTGLARIVGVVLFFATMWNRIRSARRRARWLICPWLARLDQPHSTSSRRLRRSGASHPSAGRSVPGGMSNTYRYQFGFGSSGKPAVSPSRSVSLRRVSVAAAAPAASHRSPPLTPVVTRTAARPSSQPGSNAREQTCRAPRHP
jgi:hypothetical protein